MNNAICVDPFPSLIWKYKFNFRFPEWKAKLYLHSENNTSHSYLEEGDSYSSVSSQDQPIHLWDELNEFRIWLPNIIKQNCKYHCFKDKQYTILNSWFNIHRPSGKTLEHYHNKTDLVVTCYLDKPQNTGNIEFRDPLEYHKSNTSIEPEELLWKEVDCKTNDILIFPGWVRHRTQPNRGDKDRVVMTINIGSYEF